MIARGQELGYGKQDHVESQVLPHFVLQDGAHSIGMSQVQPLPNPAFASSQQVPVHHQPVSLQQQSHIAVPANGYLLPRRQDISASQQDNQLSHVAPQFGLSFTGERGQLPHVLSHGGQKRNHEGDYSIAMQRDFSRRRILPSSRHPHGDQMTESERISFVQSYPGNSRRGQMGPGPAAGCLDDGRMASHSTPDAGMDPSQASPMWAVSVQTPQAGGPSTSMMHHPLMQDSRVATGQDGGSDVHGCNVTPERRSGSTRSYIQGNQNGRDTANENFQQMNRTNQQMRWHPVSISERQVDHMHSSRGTLIRLDDDRQGPHRSQADEGVSRGNFAPPLETLPSRQRSSPDASEDIYGSVPGESCSERKRRLARERQRRRRSKLKQNADISDMDVGQSSSLHVTSTVAGTSAPNVSVSSGHGNATLCGSSIPYTENRDIRSSSFQEDDGVTQERHVAQRQPEFHPCSQDELPPRSRPDNGNAGASVSQLFRSQLYSAHAYEADQRDLELQQNANVEHMYRPLSGSATGPYRTQPQFAIDNQRSMSHYGVAFGQYAAQPMLSQHAHDVVSAGDDDESPDVLSHRRETVMDVSEGNFVQNSGHLSESRLAHNMEINGSAVGSVDMSIQGGQQSTNLSTAARRSNMMKTPEQHDIPGASRLHASETLQDTPPESLGASMTGGEAGEVKSELESAEERKRRLARQRQRKRREKLRASVKSNADTGPSRSGTVDNSGSGSSDVAGPDQDYNPSTGIVSREGEGVSQECNRKSEGQRSGQMRELNRVDPESFSQSNTLLRNADRSVGGNVTCVVAANEERSRIRRSERLSESAIQRNKRIETNVVVKARGGDQGRGRRQAGERVERGKEGRTKGREAPGGNVGEIRDGSTGTETEPISWHDAFESETQAIDAVNDVTGHMQEFLESRWSGAQLQYVLQRSIAELGSNDPWLRALLSRFRVRHR